MNYKKDNHRIAYLSLEIALDKKFSTYAGGLGVLAGDFLRSAADLKLPFVGLSLLNKNGYFRQKISQSGQQIASLESNDLTNSPLIKKLPETVKIFIGSEEISVGVWQYLINQELPVYLLDTDLPENKAAWRNLTSQLYGGNSIYRLQQEIVLGRGGVKILRALGYEIEKFHINEGHGIFAAIELFLAMAGQDEIKKRAELSRKLVFTNHTTVRAGQDIFPLATVLTYQPDFPANFTNLMGSQEVNLTQLAIALAGQINGVSKNHKKILAQEYPAAAVDYITNGVHAAFWSAPEFTALYNKYLPNWQFKNSLLKKAKRIPLIALAEAHRCAKQRLLDYVFEQTGISLDLKIFTLVFARRFTAYKQPLLLLGDLDRLLKLNQRWPLQIIYAGKAHPEDLAGQKMIESIYQFKEKYNQQIKIVFLENYNITLAQLLTAGADLWLNNPLPPNEACGTSGMKASLNGVPQLSSPDGWWLEAYRKNKNGWLIKHSQAADLYQILETEILPLYYKPTPGWNKIMRTTISTNAPIYNSERMVKEYWRKSYGN